MPLPLQIVSGCFHPAMAKLSSCDRDGWSREPADLLCGLWKRGCPCPCSKSFVPLSPASISIPPSPCLRTGVGVGVESLSLTISYLGWNSVSKRMLLFISAYCCAGKQSNLPFHMQTRFTHICSRRTLLQYTLHSQLWFRGEGIYFCSI